MSTLVAYAASSDSDSDVPATHSHPRAAKRPRFDAAPDVVPDIAATSRIFLDPRTATLEFNPTYADLTRPVAGPVGFAVSLLSSTGTGSLAMATTSSAHQALMPTSTLMGSVEPEVISDADFTREFRTFQTLGYARDPSLAAAGETYIGDVEKAKRLRGATIYDKAVVKDRVLVPRKDKGDVAVLEGDGRYLGPWAGYEGECDGQPEGALEPPPPTNVNETTPATAALQEEFPDEDAPNPADTAPGTERTVFHGESERDYLGRTYMHIPRDLDGVDLTKASDIDAMECFLPKKVIHTWQAHVGPSRTGSASTNSEGRGVSAIRFLPTSGHLLLSAGMDAKIKLFDVYHDRSLQRTYLGHDRAVRDIHFSQPNNGAHFISSSYDRTIKLWDTETGACVRRFNIGKIAYCVRFHPQREHIFLAGCSDRRVLQMDTRSGKIVQVYNEHLSAINTVTFVDGGRRFVSTSDDKTLRAWEFGIPVVIKYAAEPEMHAMPSVTLHPRGRWLACQSLDDQIMVYGTTRDKFRQHRDKFFTGHKVGGYACQVAFSPDGRFLSSGDAQGRVFHWDFKTGKLLKKAKAHDGVCVGVEWHPRETSKVATCGWDGLIKYWD